MKARHIKSIRLRLGSAILLMKELEKWAKKEKDNEHFKQFDCSEFFEGKTMAEINIEKYYKQRELIDRKITMYKRLLNNLTNKKRE